MNDLQLHFADYLPVAAYLLLLFYLGRRAWRKTDASNQSDFLLANRTLSLPAFVATLVTTWYGGILGVGEFTYLYGISTWIVFGLPYYVFALLFALFLARKIRTGEQLTIADRFAVSYGKPAAVLAGVFLLFMTSPAPYILMIAVLLQAVFGWTLLPSLITGTLASVIYVFFGGFRSVVNTDKLQFLLMYGGFVLLLVFCVVEFGGFEFLTAKLPARHFSPSGGNSLQVIVVWFFLASWTFVDPGFHQRCAAAGTPQLARRGIFISVVFWFLFDGLTVTCGLYAAAVLPDINPALAFPLLAEKVLPVFLKGIFFTALLAVIMSTIDSFTFLSALTFGRDIVWRLSAVPDENRVASYTRWGLLLTAAVSILLAWLLPSIIQLWYVIGSLFIPPMLLPLLTSYFPKFKMTPGRTLTVMLAGFSLSLLWFISGKVNMIDGVAVYPLGVEPFFPGLLLSVAGYSFNKFIRLKV